jgi:transposase InsO family protein
LRCCSDRICRENGISHRHTGLSSPTTTGKIERFHQSLRREFLGLQVAAAQACAVAVSLTLSEVTAALC